MTRRRIAIVVPGLAPDPDDPSMAAVLDLIDRLAAAVDVRVIALRHPAAPARWARGHVEVVALGAGARHGARGRIDVLRAGIGAVVAAHRAAPLDAVVGWWLDEPGAVAALAGRRIGRPSVASLMGGELVALPDIGYGAALGRGGRWTVRIARRLATLRTAPTTAATATLATDGRPTATLPLGVDGSAWSPPPAGTSRQPGRVLFVGSLEPVKDPGLVLHAMARLAAARPGLRLEVIGDGSLGAELATVAADLGLADRIAWRGRRPRAELLAAYRSASVLVVASRHEAQSMVAVEAAACGLPIVGPPVGVLPDLGRAVRVVAPWDLVALADGLAAVLDDPALAAAMGAAGRMAATTTYDLDRTAAAWLARIEALSGGPAGPPAP